jgi:hypothetical protein
MPDLTAKRTLVKSPPELWDELSEVDRLAKHLGAFGEITITKLEPEHTVAWEGEHASGTVSIEPSGWGTKVTLRAELPETEEAEPAEAEPEDAADDSTEAQHVDDQIRPFRVEPDAEPVPDASKPEPTKPSTEGQHVSGPFVPFRVEPQAEPEAETEPEPSPGSEPDPVAEREADADAETPEPAPRRGFWGWLFRRRTEPVTREPEPVAAGPGPVRAGAEPEPIAAEPEPEPVGAAAEPEPVAAEPEPVAAETEPAPVAAESEPDPEPDPEPASAAPHVDADALGDAAALDPERVRVILDEALDALGAAHHRPFSRG